MTTSVLTNGVKGRYVSPVEVVYRAGGEVAIKQEGKVTLLSWEVCREIARLWREEMEPLAGGR